MSEGLSGTEAGKEIAEHAKHSSGHRAPGRRDRIVSIAEAALLSLVTLAAAWSGYAAAKWDGESSVRLAVASEEDRREPGRPRREGGSELRPVNL